MKNKGFTLVELLGVIVILGIMALVVFPPIINQMKNMRMSVSDATKKLIYSSVDKYMSNNRNTYPKKEDVTYCIKLQELVDGGVINSPIKDAETGQSLSLEQEVVVDLGSGYVTTYELVDEDGCGYIDPTGAKAPELTSNMIPVKWNGTNWIKADIEEEWYNYGQMQWANAVFVTAASRTYYKKAEAGTIIEEANILMYYVWIPRYRYKLFNTTSIVKPVQQIEIIFEGKRTTESNGDDNGEWLTHPAFNFGTLKLNGIWVAKFETAYSGAANTAGAEKTLPEEHKAIIKPNTYSWRNISLSDMFTVADEINKNGNRYGISTTSDTHLMKNTEWGAVAYLSQSAYGKYGNPSYNNTVGFEKGVWINPNTNHLTGCAGASIYAIGTTSCNSYETTNGVKASTTGNIYGVYDTSGGSWEFVMGGLYNSGNTTMRVQTTGFVQATIDSANMLKYVNKYAYSTTSTEDNDYNRRILGDATGEVRDWNGNGQMIYSDQAWFLRGGYSSGTTSTGPLYFRRNPGAPNIDYTFRITLIPQV